METRQGFLAYVKGEGRREHDDLQAQLHGAGIFGVPTYVIDGEVFFGREHLPAVRWLLGEVGTGPAPDVAYDRFESAAVIAFAFDYISTASLLAFKPTCALADELDVPIEWLPVPGNARPAPSRCQTGCE